MLEERLFKHYENLIKNLEEIAKLGRKKHEGYAESVQRLIEDSDKEYEAMKKLILNSLRYIIKNDLLPASYVLLAPPLNCKAGFPGLAVMRRLKKKHVKWLVENLLHKPAVKQLMKEGNPVKYEPETDPDFVNWQFFKTKDVHELIEYLLQMKEAPDYLKFIEDMIKFKHREDKISFFEYYLKKYIKHRPKLFVYGVKDLYLKPFLPFARKKINKFYESCGNAEIYYGNFSHIMMDNPNQQFGALTVKGTKITEKIIKFLDKNM